MKSNTTHHRHHDHGDGLHEDLVKLATRRTRCASSAPAAPPPSLRRSARRPRWQPRQRLRCPTRPPARIPGTAPTAPTCSTTPASCAMTSAAASADSTHARDGRPAAGESHGHRCLEGLCAAVRARRLPVALRSLWQVLDVLERASRTRTICAGSRRPTAKARRGSRRSSPPPTRGAGRTSTSRSTRRSPRPSPTGRSSRPRRSRCRRRSARRSTRPADTRPAAATSRAPRSSTDMVFGDDKAIHQLATVTGSVKNGFVANLTIGI